MSPLVQDFRYAARMLRRTPVFTAVATLTLALGIGGNSAIFTLINAALLRPLPFPQPDRLVLVWEDTSMFGLKDSPVAWGNFVEWRRQNRTLQRMGALEQRTFRLSGTGDPQQLAGSIVNAGVFETLGVRPAWGRLFRDDEDQPGAARTAILSDGLWRREFGGDPTIVGRSIDLNDEKTLVVGVMPAGFRFPDSSNEVWMPIGTALPLEELSNKGRHNAMVVGRLKPGVSIAQADQDISEIARHLERDFPRTNARVGAFVAPLRDHFVAGVRNALVVLGGAVGFVLLIACANIANLLLSRASHRRREIALRAALGASRFQVARQLLAENLLLAFAGGIAGLAIAFWGVRFLSKLLPGGIAAMAAVTVDAGVLVFTLGVSLVTGVVFGFIPVIEMLRVDLHHVLKQGGARQGTTRGSGRIRHALVVSEVALAFVLAIGAALFLQSFSRLRGMDPGFRTTNLLVMQTPLAGRQYRDADRRTAFNQQVLDRVRALPGVVSAGFTNGIPLVVKGNVNGFLIEHRPSLSENRFTNGNFRVVTEDYLRTLGVPLRAGRSLDSRDRPEAPPVALINEAMQRKYWPDDSALGKRFRFGDTRPWVTIVGIVGDIRQSGLDKAPAAEMYLPGSQAPVALTGLAIRTNGDPALLAAAVRREIRAVDASVPVTGVRTMEEVLDREVFQQRAQMLLLSMFAAVALLLASLGIYGVLAYAVAQRTQEIGVRMALGAQPRDILLATAWQGIALSAIGVAAGAVAGFGLTRLVSKLLFGIAPTDPATFAGIAALLLAVAALASYLPARRAMRIDPILALRDE